MLSEEVTLPDQNAIFIACCSMTTTHPDNTATIEDLARSTTVNKEWGGSIHLMALSNVLNCPITSVYPDVHHAVRPLYSAIFKPTLTDVCEQTKESMLSTFYPNHVVALLCRESVADEQPVNTTKRRRSGQSTWTTSSPNDQS